MDTGTFLASRIKGLAERTLFRHGRLNEFKKSHYAEIRVRCPDGHRLYVSKHDGYVCITYVWPVTEAFVDAPQSGFELRFENDIANAECRVFGAFGHQCFKSVQPQGELEALHDMFNVGSLEGEVYEAGPIE